MFQFKSLMVRIARGGACAIAVLLLSAVALAGEAPKVNADPERVAIKGYDPVAYFTVGQAVQGSEEFEYQWLDARWRFTSAAHRDLFTADPERYAPQYGGFCTGSMANGMMGEIDPEAWAIVDGKLYLNSNIAGRDEFVQNPSSEIAKAGANWVKLQSNAQ